MTCINFEIIKYIKKHGKSPDIPELNTTRMDMSEKEAKLDYLNKLMIAKSLNKEEK